METPSLYSPETDHCERGPSGSSNPGQGVACTYPRFGWEPLLARMRTWERRSQLGEGCERDCGLAIRRTGPIRVVA